MAETLQARDMRVQFDGLVALDDVDLDVRRGEVLGLIGPNGSGKTTMVNAITGFVKPDGGSVRVGARVLTKDSPAARARHGVGRTFQGARSFGALTVLENVEAAALMKGGKRAAVRQRAALILDQFALADKAETPASALTTGDERRLSVARAVATQPRFLLLDEPGAGLNEPEAEQLFDALEQLTSDLEIGLLVIDHDMRLIMALCDRIHVLDHGKTIAEGTPDEVRTDPAVIAAYLVGADVSVDPDA